MHAWRGGHNQPPLHECEIRNKQYKNSKNLLAHRLGNLSWQTLEFIDNIDLKVAYFDCCITTRLSTFLPFRVIRRHSNDKPWIADVFCRMIGTRVCQRKLCSIRSAQSGQPPISKELRQRFHSSRVQSCVCPTLETRLVAVA